jgi:hypothetical protein
VHGVGIGQRLVVPESQHTITERLEEGSPLSVGPGLHRMLPTVELHDHLQLTAAEVDDVCADRDLARELRAQQAPVTEPRP